MKTLRLAIDPGNLESALSRSSIAQTAAILRRGGLVAFPSETVYGLGANALDSEAAQRIFAAKQRPAWDPLIVHIADLAMLPTVTATSLSRSANALASAFWPGPLTLLLPRAEAIPFLITAGRPLVAVRLPAHPVARALIAAAGVPIAAPSANRFGRTSPTQAMHVLEDLDGRIDAILDGGETTLGLESTVVDPSEEPVVIYRPGMITVEAIRRICGSASLWQENAAAEPQNSALPKALPSPGAGIAHYAPRARLLLIAEAPPAQTASFLAALAQAERSGVPFGVMLPANFLPAGSHAIETTARIFPWGDWQNASELAHRLFAGLRQLDAAGVQLILCPLPSPAGIGAALQDRLFKAAKAEQAASTTTSDFHQT